MAADHPFRRSPVRVLKAEIDHSPMDCCDSDPRKVWVVAVGWTYRRAVLTHAEPFLEAAGLTDVEALEDMIFMASLDLNNPPPFEHEGGERLEWPDLVVAPSIEEIHQRLGIAQKGEV